MMLRPLLKLILALSLLLLMPILLIRARSYDDGELRAFLSPPQGCSAPCFMGIRPGETTVDDTLARLRAHEWVADVIAIPYYDRKDLVGTINWRWSGLQPGWIDAETEGRINIYENVARSISIKSNIGLGDLWLTLGRPDRDLLAAVPVPQLRHLNYSATYRELQLYTSYDQSCSTESLQRGSLWLTWFGNWDWLQEGGKQPFNFVVNRLIRCFQGS